MSKKLVLLLLSIFILSCQSDDNSGTQELSLPESLIGSWELINYHSDTFLLQEQTGRIEDIVPEETDYGIEFTDNPKKIILSGFLRYTFKEYEIVDDEKVVTYEATNFMDSEHGEGLHTGEWNIVDGFLVCTDVGDQDTEYNTISSVELDGDILKLTLDDAQFGSHLSGETILEYRKK